MMTSTSSPNHPTVQAISLIAREASIPAIGELDTPNRPIGFASIFLSLDNPVHAKQTLTLESVEVISMDTRNVLFRQTEPHAITLMPLERMPLDIQLRNQQGYPGTDRVKAIATYRVPQSVTERAERADAFADEGGKEYRIESPVVEVERSP